MDLLKRLSEIPSLDRIAMEQAQARMDNIAKPMGSLGFLEQVIVKIAGLIGDADVRLDQRAVVVMCSDNGVVREGVASTPPVITRVMTENMAKDQTCVCVMARQVGAGVIPVDIGMFEPASVPGVMDRHVARGTKNMAEGPAMSMEQAVQAIETGIALVAELKNQGYQLLAAGEMGIGNTTTASAVASVLLNKPVEMMTGPGAGLTDEALQNKKAVIRRAIEINKPDPGDPLDVLAKVGGLDMAGMCGLYLGGALYRVPILVDGFISAVSALVAKRLCHASFGAMLPSHVSAEPAGPMVLDALDLLPLITANMRLGEGTGATAAIALIDMMLHVYHEMITFADIGM
ncbi:MAG: nicotinate-nucleotide--dimethylbenzimidazole phosphoribosyltransferase [Clostridia bacterium]|nr:nicotinate-nucleotide--dimethylbenzimidazole phosphoribosyltransferase [Clostridia bacterium]